MKPIDTFKKNWQKIIDDRVTNYKLVENLLLEDNNNADVAIYKDEKCIAFGNYFDTLKLPTDRDIRYYFHLKDGFTGCGTASIFWFYFDENRIIINDHKYIYPYYELLNDYNNFSNRLTEENI
jgi:hypothetical protein